MKAALVLLLVGTAILFVEATVSVISETLKESKDLLVLRYGKPA